MQFIKKTINFIEKHKKEKEKKDIKSLIEYLKELKRIESSLWGITINHFNSGEEEVLEDTNHLIYLISKNKEDNIKEILKSKEFYEFIKDLENLKEDFNYLKKKIKEKNKLRNMISNFTIKLVQPENYNKMEKIFLLEKKLYDIIDLQDLELNKLISDVKKLKINSKEIEIEISLNYLKEIRKILSAHQDSHNLWNQERFEYSSTSNIIHELLKIIENTLN